MQFKGSKLVTDRFGRWPKFHDAEVKRVSLMTPGKFGDLASVQMELHCWETTSELDEAGYYKLKNHSLVTFLFEHLEDIYLENFNHQNAINALEIESLASEEVGKVAWRITVDPSFGLELELRCQRIQVLSVVACDEEGL
jgi:hypothetical protein